MNKKQLLPLGLLLFVILIVYLTNIHEELSLSKLREKHVALQGFLHAHPYLSPFLFIAIYSISVCLIPDSTLLTLFAGMSFPWPLALLYCSSSETLGALLFFSITRGLGQTLDKHEYLFLRRMRLSFKKNGASYLLFLRISHILPFWLINFSAAYFNVRLLTFIWTTFVGVLPLTYLLIRAGSDLEKAIALDAPFRISSLFTTQTKLALLLLGLTALCPILYKKWTRK